MIALHKHNIEIKTKTGVLFKSICRSQTITRFDEGLRVEKTAKARTISSGHIEKCHSLIDHDSLSWVKEGGGRQEEEILKIQNFFLTKDIHWHHVKNMKLTIRKLEALGRWQQQYSFWNSLDSYRKKQLKGKTTDLTMQATTYLCDPQNTSSRRQTTNDHKIYTISTSVWEETEEARRCQMNMKAPEGQNSPEVLIRSLRRLIWGQQLKLGGVWPLLIVDELKWQKTTKETGADVSHELRALSCLGSLAGEYSTMRESADGEIEGKQNIPAEDEQLPQKQSHKTWQSNLQFQTVQRDIETTYKT